MENNHKQSRVIPLKTLKKERNNQASDSQPKQIKFMVFAICKPKTF